jgi:Zn-dependent M28 family amino/carboxypeptidase
LFGEAGCDRRHLSEQSVRGSTLTNVVCVLPGTSDKTIIVGANFDHSPAGDGGVIDNWSSVSLLPSLYQSIAFVPRLHTYVFIGFADQEKGAVGAQYYAQHLTKEQVGSTSAMVDMEMLGLGPAEIWASHSDDHLIGQLLYVAHLLDSSIVGTNLDQFTHSDSEGFAKRKIPRITIHTLTQEVWDAHIIHTPKDNLSVIQPEEYYQTYSLIAAYLAFLDLSEPIPPVKWVTQPADTGKDDPYTDPPVYPPRRYPR